MKKSLFLVSIVSIILLLNGCKDSNNNPPTITNSVDYEFTVIIDGVSNKVKGTFDNPVDYVSLLNSRNIPTFEPTKKTLSIAIFDITHPDYVEGHPFVLNITFERNILGTVKAGLSFDASLSPFYRDKYVRSGNIPSDVFEHRHSLTQDTSINIDNIDVWSNWLQGLASSFLNDQDFNKISTDIQITDLGTLSTIQADGKYKLGETLKGYMPKTKLYYPSSVNLQPPGVLNVKWSPIELEFSFKTIRR